MVDQRFRAANVSQKQGYKDLVVGWLRTQLRFHADPIKARRDSQEADVIEATLQEKAQEDARRAVFETVMPASWKRKIGDLERHAEEQRAEPGRRQRAEHEARPRADVVMTFSGDLAGQIQTPLPALVTRPESAGDALTVELSPLDPIAVGGRSFRARSPLTPDPAPTTSPPSTNAPAATGTPSGSNSGSNRTRNPFTGSPATAPPLSSSNPTSEPCVSASRRKTPAAPASTSMQRSFCPEALAVQRVGTSRPR